MSAVDDILGAMPADQISQQVGASPDEVRTAAAAVLPALLGGLQANAGDPSGAGSILQALGQHDDDLLTGGADLSAIDEQDGTAIASHIFGDQEDEVVNRLGGLPAVGGSGAGGALVRKLLPILAPMVLSWLANRVLKGGGGGLGGGTAAAQPDTSPSPSLPAAAAAALPARSTTCCATCSAARPVGGPRRRRARRPVAGQRPASTPAASSGTCSAASSVAGVADHHGRARSSPTTRMTAPNPAAHHAVSAGMPR